MLRLETIHKGTFALLKALSSREELKAFALAGGTALALQLGHRISDDLDFMTRETFDSVGLLESLAEDFELENSSTAVNAVSLFIKWQGASIKTDCLRHNYPLLRPLIASEKIRLFALEDIAAMKLNAVANRGAKKDFYDIHVLLFRFSLAEMLGFFETKYQSLNSFTVLKSLTYFDDADPQPDPRSLTDLSWSQIKRDLQQRVRDFA